MRIGVVGGTGNEGRGLALRWARAGHQVRIGSRDADRGREAAHRVREAGAAGVEGGDNAWAVSGAEVVLLSVPYAAHQATLRGLREALQGKIVIDITVPLKPPKVRQVHLPDGQAAALEAQQLLGPEVRVVAGLHHVSAAHLSDASHAIDCDVLLCSDDDAALETVAGLIRDLGVSPVHAGGLRNAIALEALTPVLLHINKRYKVPASGIRLTGLPE